MQALDLHPVESSTEGHSGKPERNGISVCLFGNLNIFFSLGLEDCLFGVPTFDFDQNETIHCELPAEEAEGENNPTPEANPLEPIKDASVVIESSDAQIAEDFEEGSPRKGERNARKTSSTKAKVSSTRRNHRSQSRKMKTLQLERKENIKTFNEKINEKDGGYFCKCGKFTSGLRLKALSHALNCGKKVNRNI